MIRDGLSGRPPPYQRQKDSYHDCHEHHHADAAQRGNIAAGFLQPRWTKRGPWGTRRYGQASFNHLDVAAFTAVFREQEWRHPEQAELILTPEDQPSMVLRPTLRQDEV